MHQCDLCERLFFLRRRFIMTRVTTTQTPELNLLAKGHFGLSRNLKLHHSIYLIRVP